MPVGETTSAEDTVGMAMMTMRGCLFYLSPIFCKGLYSDEQKLEKKLQSIQLKSICNALINVSNEKDFRFIFILASQTPSKMDTISFFFFPLL